MSMIIDGTNGLTFNNATTQNSGGKVLQVIVGTSGSSYTPSLSSYGSAGTTVTITPLFSTSKILIISANQVYAGGASRACGLALYRNNSTQIFAPTLTYGSYYNGNSSDGSSIISVNYLDSPATTSATTYTIYAQAFNSSPTINHGCSATIFAWEIAQ
jgi:hypothetical protein